jgi:hypothetical protein
LPSSTLQQKTGTLAGLGEAEAAQGGNCLTDPLDIWLAEALILNENKPVNPLKWWLQQKRIGNTHGGLLQMALDVLSCPGGYTSSTLTLAWYVAQTDLSSSVFQPHLLMLRGLLALGVVMFHQRGTGSQHSRSRGGWLLPSIQKIG